MMTLYAGWFAFCCSLLTLAGSLPSARLQICTAFQLDC